jgi:nitric oxide reductase subunit C
MAFRQIVFLFFILVTTFLIYTFYLYANLPFKQVSVSTESLKGKEIWQEKNCNACHQIYGLGGFLGPDLSNVYSLKSPDYIKAFIINGTDIMPKFNLSNEEINCLIAYLKSVDATGKADPKKIKLNIDGTISN